MDAVLIIGRILMGLLFVLSSIGHLTETASLTDYAKYKKVPFPQPSVVASGLVFLFCGVGVAVGVYPTISAFVLAALLVPTTVLFHKFWGAGSKDEADTERIAFNKNVAIIGGLLAIAVASYESATTLVGI